MPHARCLFVVVATLTVGVLESACAEHNTSTAARGACAAAANSTVCGAQSRPYEGLECGWDSASMICGVVAELRCGDHDDSETCELSSELAGGATCEWVPASAACAPLSIRGPGGAVPWQPQPWVPMPSFKDQPNRFTTACYSVLFVGGLLAVCGGLRVAVAWLQERRASKGRAGGARGDVLLENSELCETQVLGETV